MSRASRLRRRIADFSVLKYITQRTYLISVISLGWGTGSGQVPAGCLLQCMFELWLSLSGALRDDTPGRKRPS